MSEHEMVETRATVYAKGLLALFLIIVPLVSLVYFTPLAPALQAPFAYFIIIAPIPGIALAIALYKTGIGSAPLLPSTVGIFMIAGGAMFDVTMTVLKTPTLSREGNEIVRALLSHGFSIGFLYLYGFFAQTFLVVFTCILWLAFLRHKETILRLAWSYRPKSFLDFVKAVTGAGHLSWRQSFFPLKLSELPKSYFLIWLLPIAWVGISPFRWLLGLEWLGIVPVYLRYKIAAWWLVMFGILCIIWLWTEYAKALIQKPVP